MKRQLFTSLSMLMLTGILCTPAWAASMYSVDNAVSDSYHGASHFHALWMPGLDNTVGPYFVFNTPGTFTQTGTTAKLTGTVVSSNDSNRGWKLNVDFSGLTNIAPPGSPKKELKAAAYASNGGPVDTSSWNYYTQFRGTLTGTGLYSGASVFLNRFGPAFQLGEGANGKNILNGGSGWFSWRVGVSNGYEGPRLRSRFDHGDFNLEFGTPPTTATPEPSTIVLLGSGLAGVFAWRQRKSSLKKANT